MKRLLPGLLLLPLLAWGQVGTFPPLVGARGTANPTNCSIGQLFYRTDLNAVMSCSAANTWIQATNSGGSLATPITVANGGTERTTGTTAYSLVATGTTATGAQQTLANGATTEVLVGGGAAALPAWTPATGSGSPVRATAPTLTTAALSGVTNIGVRSQITGSDRIAVSSATTVFTLGGGGGSVGSSSALVLCNGYRTDSVTLVWSDLLLVMASVTPVVVTTTSKNTPAARTWSISGSAAMQVAMAANTYNVSCFSLEQPN